MPTRDLRDVAVRAHSEGCNTAVGDLLRGTGRAQSAAVVIAILGVQERLVTRSELDPSWLVAA